MNIIYEDSDLFALNKEPGMVVNRAESVKEKTIQDVMEERLEILNSKFEIRNPAEETFLQRSGMVHRLDKDTSGVMLWAKHPAAMMELMRQFKAREVKKEYLALVHGKLEPKSGFIRLPIARSTYNRQQFVIDPFGKHAHTDYKVINYKFKEKGERRKKEEGVKKTIQPFNFSATSSFSLVHLYPKTGRTHQIRVHMRHLGHPLVSDQLYLGKKALKDDLHWCPRHFLHASSITFSHPSSKEVIYFEAPLTADLAKSLQVLHSK